MELEPNMWTESDQCVCGDTDRRQWGPLLLPPTPQTEGGEWVLLLGYIAWLLKREQEENSEANDSPHKQTWLFRALQICHWSMTPPALKMCVISAASGDGITRFILRQEVANDP